MKTLILSLLLIVSACAHNHQHESKEPVEQNIQIGKSLNAHRYADIYFSAQPNDADFAALKKQGFTHIINLRESSEYNEKNERELLKKENLLYSHIPLNGKNKLTNETINQVTTAVLKHRKQGKTLIHCSSGQRVALWVGGHFYKDHKYSKEKSLEIAKTYGLKNEALIETLNEYLLKNNN